MVAFIIIAVIIVAVIVISVKTHSSYERKVDEVKNLFIAEVAEFTPLVNQCFEVRTDGKKIKTWDGQHKIDYIINKNKDQAVRSLLLYYDLVEWWDKNGDVVIKKVIQKGNNMASQMYICGGSFRKRIEQELRSLVVTYNPSEIKFSFRTYTVHSNTRHYNPNTGDWWYGDSPEQSTFKQSLSPSEILERVEILAKYNFEMTEYQYNVDNQRKLMTLELRQQIIARDNGICQICKKICDPSEIEIDHIKPVSKGGKTTPSNLQVLCSKCNRQKSNKWLEDISSTIRTATSKTPPKVVKTEDPRWENFNKKYNETKYNNLRPKANGVQVGDRVKFRFVDEDDEMTLRLVEDGIKVESDTVSVAAPIGEAILGQAQGDIIEVRTPSGIETIQIVEIYKKQ